MSTGRRGTKTRCDCGNPATRTSRGDGVCDRCHELEQKRWQFDRPTSGGVKPVCDPFTVAPFSRDFSPDHGRAFDLGDDFSLHPV